jgi:hypothetical protein
VKKVVYWQAPRSDRAYSWFNNSLDVWIRDYFKRAGYEVVNAGQLKQMMVEQVKSKAPSVVVFAENRIPKTVVGEYSEKALIRQYLDAGGKVALLGPNPLAYYFDDETGGIDSMDFSVRPKKVFDIAYDAPGFINNNSMYSSEVTAAGKKWGLRGWWVGYSFVDPSQVTEVLAINEYGQASSWIKNYGGPQGTGLIQLAVPIGFEVANLHQLRLAIEPFLSR